MHIYVTHSKSMTKWDVFNSTENMCIVGVVSYLLG